MNLVYSWIFFWSLISPTPIDWAVFHAVEDASEIDTWTTLRIIAIESKFQEKAVSPVGAVGLMQITPIALKEVKQRALSGELQGCDDTLLYSFKEMKKPFPNVRVGSCFIRYLKKVYSKEKYVLAHYNGGGRAVRALYRGRPWKETKKYLLRWAIYNKLLRIGQ